MIYIHAPKQKFKKRAYFDLCSVPTSALLPCGSGRGMSGPSASAHARQHLSLRFSSLLFSPLPHTWCSCPRHRYRAFMGAGVGEMEGWTTSSAEEGQGLPVCCSHNQHQGICRGKSRFFLRSCMALRLVCAAQPSDGWRGMDLGQACRQKEESTRRQDGADTCRREQARTRTVLFTRNTVFYLSGRNRRIGSVFTYCANREAVIDFTNTADTPRNHRARKDACRRR